MSGDVQPRKRKDKKKKKEGTSLGNIHEPVAAQKFKRKLSDDEEGDSSPILGSVDQGEKIHIHSDHGIGGNICVKIIFFCLLAALVGAVGIILIHSRGSTDVDLPSIEESRFADYFTGWLDDGADDHGHDEPELGHGDDEDDEHGEEETGEKSGEEEEEEDHGEDHGDEAELNDGSPEAGEEEDQEGGNAEETIDDSEENEEIDEDADEDAGEETFAPKFKVIHRFKHFFNRRKDSVKEISERKVVTRKFGRFTRRDYKRDKEDEDEEEKEKEEEEEEEEEDEDEEREKDEEEDEAEEKEEEEVEVEEDEEEEKEEEEDEDEEEEKEEEEDEDEEEEKEEEEEVKVEEDEEEEKEEEEDEDEEEEKEEEEDEDEEEEKEEEEDEDEEEEKEEEEELEVEEDEEDEEEEQEVEVKGDDEDDKDKNEDESEEAQEEELVAEDDEDEESEVEEDGGKDQEENDGVETSELADEEENKEVEDEDQDESNVIGEDGEDENAEDKIDELGLEEIDESEEVVEEGGEEETVDEEQEKAEVLEEQQTQEEVQLPEEPVEIDSKITEIEEKLNQILREKRKKVEQRKMELEEIEIGTTAVVEDANGDEEEDGNENESSGVAVKVLVGIALVIVAHMVLVQKWNTLGNVPTNAKPEPENENQEINESITSRNQTLVSESSNLNKIFADEIEEYEEEEESEEEVEDEEEEEEEYEEEMSVEEEYSEDEVLPKLVEKRSWNLDKSPDKEEEEEYSKEEEVEEEEEYSEEEEVEDEEELEDEEVEYDEEYEEEEEELEEDDYDWKRVESVLPEPPIPPPHEEPPIPPPRRSHLSGGASGERTGGGPQAYDEYNEMPYEFEEPEEMPEPVDEDEERMTEPEEDNPKLEEEEEDDWLFKREFKYAEEQLENNPKSALREFDAILARKTNSIRALIGRAKCLDRIAEMERSNQYLKRAIEAYKTLLSEHENLLSNQEYISLSERCIDRMRFGGYLRHAVSIHQSLIKKFPSTPKHRNDLAVTYLFLNEIHLARALLNETLKQWPKNGFALVHYGFILKTTDNEFGQAADKLIQGIRTREPGVIDGRFFFHLGDALNRLGRGKEAIEWYDMGVKEGLFRSRYQRSLYNVNRLKAQPWWSHQDTTYHEFFKKLEDNWQEIRKEGLNLLNAKGVNLFKPETENLKDTGDWRQLDLYFRGRKHSNCDSAPFTCSLISSFHPASTCTRGQVKFSVMLPSTHVWPHCGPTNCRLRSHLGLVVPKNTFLRVAEEIRSWEEGKVIVFDDSFEHEVWHNGTGARLVLIVDVWHPELTHHERKYLSPI